MIDFARAFRRPFTDLISLVLGFIFSVVPVVNLLALGYHVDCARTAQRKKKDMPRWADFRELLADGVVAFLIALIYLIPALAIVAVAAANSADSGFGFITEGFSAILILIFLLMASYMMPASFVLYADRGNIAAAFDPRLMGVKMLKPGYFMVWLVMTAYFSVLVGLLGIISYAGMALAFFVTGVTAATAFAEV